MNIILFNGPPGCGKDTAAMAVLINRFGMPGTVKFDRMSMPIKRAFAGTYDAEISKMGNIVGWEERKDEPHALLDGKSYRQWQIDFSEKFMKPLYGPDIFPRLLARRHYHRLNDPAYTVLVPDCGFDVEANYLIEQTHARVFLMRIQRPGSNYAIDSRSNLEPHRLLAGFTIIDNDSDVETFRDRVRKQVGEWIA
jgi:hypothetical protein